MRCIIALAVFLGFAHNVYAAPCYGTSMPKKNHCIGGAQTYTLVKRYLEDNAGKMRSTQHFMLLSYGPFDWLSIDLKGGAGNIKQRPVSAGEIDYDGNFAGGYGFRLKCYDAKKWKAVFGFQHISVHPRSSDIGSVTHKAILDDWQWSVLVSRDIGRLVPYLGTRWSRVDYIHTEGSERKRVMSDLTRHTGLILGCDIPCTKKIFVNLEGQFLDSEAASCSLNVKF